jgi:ankyrin repeat protein
MESNTNTAINRYNQPRYTIPYNNPDRRAPGEIVNKIFSKASSGRFFDIMSSITQERSLLNLLDLQNRSILHHILLNNDLSKNDKYDLIKKSVELGAPVDTPDIIGGVRPIHLASGQQNRKVVRYLLSKKVDPNSKTFNFMTPLHYAVMPENILCPSEKNKTLVPDTEHIVQEFHTDNLFKTVFELFKNDKIVQRYIKHISDIFRYRFVYNDFDNDMKNFSKIIKDSLAERRNGNLNENVRDKLLEFRTTLYTRTRSELALTNSQIDIKEDTENGWGPTYGGNRDNKLAVLPFSNLRNSFTELYEKDKQTFRSVIEKIKSQIKNTIAYGNVLKDNLINANNIIVELKTIYQVLFVWKTEIEIKFNNSTQVNSLLNDIDILFNKNYLNIPTVNVPTTNFENTNNFTDDAVTVNPTSFLKYNGTKKNTIFNDMNTSTGVQQTGLGVILEHYFNDINTKLHYLEQIVNQIIIRMNMGISMQEHLNTFIQVGDFQYYLLNICYTLIHFDTYAKKLSSVLKTFKLKIINDNLQPVIDHVSTIISDCIDYVNSRTPARWNNSYTIGNVKGNKFVANPPSVRVEYYNGHNIEIVCGKNNNNNYVFAKRENLRPGPGAPDGFYIYFKKTPVLSYVTSLNYISGIEKTNTSNLTDSIDKIVDAGEPGDQNETNKLYLKLIETQTKMNSMIDIYNKMNGYNFSYIFNNKMKDTTYSELKADPSSSLMLNKIKHLKNIPDTYTRFYETYNAVLQAGGAYTSANAINAVKSLINTYGVKISSSDKTYIVRNRTPADSLGINSYPEKIGIISGRLTTPITTPISPNPSLITDGIVLGQPYQYIGKPLQINKFSYNIESISVLGSVFDEHIYIIKLILLMYMTQQFSDIYTKGNTNQPLNSKEKLVYKSMKDIFTQINIVSSFNPLGTVFAVSAKMINDIYLSTVDNISNLSASNYINYLVTQQEIKDVPFKTLLSNTITNNLNEKAELITKPDDRVILRDRDMILSVISSGVNGAAFSTVPGSLSVDMLNIFKVEQNGEDTDTHRLINYDSINFNNDMCYSIDEDIIGELLSAGADPNTIARSGETPLSLAVTIQNEGIIDTLLRSGSKISGSKDVYTMCFNQLLNLIESSPILEIDDIETRVSNHHRKVSGMKSMFTNSKLIMGMTSYMFIHQLTLITNTYPNMWTREGQTNILSMLNLINVDKDFIPLAKMDPSLIDENLKGYSTLNELIDEYTSKLIENREIYIRIENSIKNLRKELTELSTNESYRRSEIDALIKELNAQNKNINLRIRDLMRKIRDIRTTKNTTSNNSAVNKTRLAIQGSSNLHRFITSISKTKTRDVCNVYDVFFNKIISAGSTDIYNSEYNTYMKVWNDLLSRPDTEREKDHTQMVGILMRRILSTGVMDPAMLLNIYAPVSDMYDKVLVKYGRDLLESMPYLSKDGESYYESNYVLKQIYCIMYHVFKHTMSINFINTIAQLLARRDKGKTEDSIMRNVYQAMKTSEFIKYVIEILPKLVIKIVCKISESEKDPDLSLTVADVLNKSLDRLLLSTFDSVDKNTVDQAKELVVPYFVSYMEIYTAEMHMFMIKQCKMMIVQGRLLRILNMLAPKTILENSN